MDINIYPFDKVYFVYVHSYLCVRGSTPYFVDIVVQTYVLSLVRPYVFLLITQQCIHYYCT